MNCETEYSLWMLLDQLEPHPEIEERKRRIVGRSLERIECASARHWNGFRIAANLTESFHPSEHSSAVEEQATCCTESPACDGETL